jgi:oxygen-independent coproporphyrinogen-3 oxidase
LRSLGFNRFSLGVQDLDPRVQVAVNRVQPLEKNLETINACREFGAHSINIDLIYGLPLQTCASFEKTLDVVINELSPDRLSVFNYAHLPHMFKPQRQIDAAQLPAAAEKLAILQMSIEKLTAAGYVYIGMDHFAKPDDELVRAQRDGKLYRNFQGYSTHSDCDLVAMGVSSISKVGLSYTANAKTLDDYYALLNEGKLPVTRGVMLDADDQLRREAIQQLTCDYAINIPEFETLMGIDFADYFSRELAMLEPMRDDGLVTLSPKCIEITPRGRLLVRNVCMVFDVSLRKQPAEQRFSRVI